MVNKFKTRTTFANLQVHPLQVPDGENMNMNCVVRLLLVVLVVVKGMTRMRA